MELNGWRAGDYRIPFRHGNAMMETIEMGQPVDGLEGWVVDLLRRKIAVAMGGGGSPFDVGGD